MRAQERITLEFYTKFREQTPGFFDVLAFNYRMLVYWAIMSSLAAVFLEIGPAPWAPFIAGAVVGAIFRDVRRMHATARFWPWMRGMLDWGEVERRRSGPGAGA